MCGIDITQGKDYLVFGYQEDKVVKGMGKRNVLEVGLCSFNVPFRTLMSEQRGQLTRFRYVDNCRPKPCDQEKECGPRPSVPAPIQCPNGSVTYYDIACVVARAMTYGPSQCRWDVKASSCPACSEDSDCSFESYCSAGLCTTKGKCNSVTDCFHPSNRPSDTAEPQCVLQRECKAGLCKSTCCKQVVDCYADPCDVLDIPFHVCSSD